MTLSVSLVFHILLWIVHGPIILFWSHLQIFNCDPKSKLLSEVSLVIVILISNVHSANFKLNIFENKSNVLYLFFFFD